MNLMSRQALAGRYGPAQKDGKKRSRTSKTGKASQTPLDFALALMRDEGKPDALRAGMAKAALPYLHTRGEAPEEDDAPAKEPMSDLELARRISHILALGRKEEEKLPEHERKIPPPGRAAEDLASNPGRSVSPPSVPPSIERRQSSRPAPVQPADERWHYDTSDPHPGYRWI